MSVIIGAGTIVTTTLFPNGGILSVSFGFEPEVSRLWQLGSFAPYDTFVQRARTLQIGVYGTRADGLGGSTSLPLTPSVTCTDAEAVEVTVTPASCTGSIAPFFSQYWPSSYAYQKDNIGYGRESWSFVSKPVLDFYNGSIFMIRGIPEGTISTGDGVMAALSMGVLVDELASNDRVGNRIEGESGGVQAGNMSIGNFDVQRFVIPTHVGASVGISATTDGLSGNANINIPMTPIFI